MIISVNWLKKFTDIDLPIDELAELIGARLVEIEQVIDLGTKYKDVVIARVADCQKLDGSDHLSVTKLDDGVAVKNVERDENGFVQVVCGAPNVKAGQLVAWLPPGSIVPETFGNAQPFVLDARKLRGVKSNGMIASLKELALGDQHDGILEIDTVSEPGNSFAEIYELNDYLLDIENKSLTHRPDCFGIIGFAREVAAIQGKTFQTPSWLNQLTPTIASVDKITPPTVVIDDAELSDRYQAIVLAGARAEAVSPLLIQTYLARVGVRPINAVVDITNYLMMLTGQPLHAFDYDKLVKAGGGQAEIHVRRGRAGEKLELLDKRQIELDSEDIVIAAGDRPVALAGAMGGADTEIDNQTKNIIIESATFNLYNLRGTQMRHGIFSEAITRFTKGQPAALTAPVLAEAVELAKQWTDASPVCGVAQAYPGKLSRVTTSLTRDQIVGVLGSNLTMEQIAQVLSNAEFLVLIEAETLRVTAPWWRADIHIPEDIIEEIGRLNGFDNIEPVLPRRDMMAVRPSGFEQFCDNLRRRLVRAGANEVLSYSFVHGDQLRRAGQDPAEAFRITNALSPDLQYYRLSILPSLLDKVNMNLRQKFDQFALFELGKVHKKGAMDPHEPDVPAEFPRLDLVIASRSENGAAYFQAKKMLEFGLEINDLTFQAFDENDHLKANLALFEPKRSAIVKLGEQEIGVVGEFKASVRRSFKLPDYSAGFSLALDVLFSNVDKNKSNYQPLSRYPAVERDICFQVKPAISYGEIIEAIQLAIQDIDIAIDYRPFDIYQPGDAATKNITLRMTFKPYDRTLTNEEVNTMVGRITDRVSGATGAKII